MDTVLECMICLSTTVINQESIGDIFIVPFVKLKCAHHLCAPCMSRLNGSLKKITCPVCRQTTTSVTIVARGPNRKIIIFNSSLKCVKDAVLPFDNFKEYAKKCMSSVYRDENDECKIEQIKTDNIKSECEKYKLIIQECMREHNILRDEICKFKSELNNIKAECAEYRKSLDELRSRRKLYQFRNNQLTIHRNFLLKQLNNINNYLGTEMVRNPVTGNNDVVTIEKEYVPMEDDNDEYASKTIIVEDDTC
ncbi:zinc finger protein CG30 [Spodoptera litura nucleopolyhedrovirus]|uniref:CG30 n=1 Tax=Spodoptera litura multicapsid nucleopolyhedrovirus TaxID=46242 RepID=Q9DWZ7_NPVST|nr:zinc finger protein CG30 [Spodoptera litura nucleopolyhedrovirus]WML75145.1 zinc finger protein cg30 [Spodoptera littoralis nucleopolyhedrovirus]AAG32099.1 CG30 [Spodoptera litura nucleopolyhedrovirus]AAL01762.1 zinc finger protein CG30 [Spodoptera litura nucleopolyhedrovirus]QHN73929.1 cg30 [Spodoptera litura nucleopolyhedrovirus]UQV25614.1 zinc finger protein CG30 [Spodoptera litura nucleopolyhedrovirus]